MTLVILLAIAGTLFGLSFLTKRRYGVLGLGLTAGLVLSREQNTEIGAILQASDFPVQPLSHIAAAAIVLTLVPVMALLFSGPRYTDQRAAIAGSLIFAIFGTVLLLPQLIGVISTADLTVLPLLSAIAANSPWIISLSIVLAVIDLMLAHSKKPFGNKGKH